MFDSISLLFLEWEMFQMKDVDIGKAYFMFRNFVPKIVPFMR